MELEERCRKSKTTSVSRPKFGWVCKRNALRAGNVKPLKREEGFVVAETLKQRRWFNCTGEDLPILGWTIEIRTLAVQ